MSSGLILLALLAALVAFGWVRMQRRLGMNVTWRRVLGVMGVFVLAVLALWAYSTHR